MSYEKLTSSSPEAQSESLIADHVNALASLFPSVVREGKVDFDALRQLLGENVAKDDELFGLQWKGKAQARRAATTPSLGTLRPCKEESVDWDTTKNLYLEGDNLEVLKLLRKSYAGKVKMIYIDPPYNTGKEFVYPDNYQNGIEEYKKLTGQLGGFKANAETSGRHHTNWLNMMYPRLVLAKDLLSEDGVIFSSIDENEIHNMRILMNEIFGEENYAGEIIWKNSSKNDQAYISIQHEYILGFVKNKNTNKGNWVEKKEGLNEIFSAFSNWHKKYRNNWEAIHQEAVKWYKQFNESNPIYSSKHYSWMDENGVYFPDNISGPNYGQYRYDVIHPITGKICKEPASGWRYPESTMKQRISENLVHFGKDETTVPNNKTYLKNTEFQSLTSIKYKDGRVASKALNLLLGGKYFTNPKDVDIIGTLCKAVDVTGHDIVLDFFAGSGTTAHTVMKINSADAGHRRFIMVQLPETCDEKSDAFRAGFGTISDIAKERIRRAGKKIKEEAGLQGQHLDIGFRVYKLDSSNLRVWNPEADDLELALGSHEKHLLPGRTQEDLLYEILLKQGIELTEDARIRSLGGKRVYSLGHGQYYACMETVISSDQIEALALGIAQWKQEESPENTQCAVFVIDEAFRSDADKLNFAKILEQHGIPSVKAL